MAKPVRELSDENPFVLKEDSYVRDIYPVKHYVDQTAWHLHLQTGKDFDYCKAWVKDQLQNKRFEGIRNPTVKLLRRAENGDREPDEVPLTKYVEEIIKNDEIVAPTFTIYAPTKHKPSILAGYITANIKKRSRAKKAKFAAMAINDGVTEFFMELEQRNRKLGNNAVSGAHASSSTPLYNQTNHSTLTSNCRITSGSGNANNEKLLLGNRHYWAPYILINNILSITQNVEYDHLEAVMTKYKLYYPSAKDVLESVKYSIELYGWGCNSEYQKLYQLFLTLTPLQRAAFLYTGDLYHIRKYNDAFMRKFISDISTKVTAEYDKPYKELGELPESYVNFGRQLCEVEWAGRGNKYKEMFEKGLKDELNVLCATTTHTRNAIFAYKDFIRVIFVSDNVPASIPHFPSSIRRSALTSDTDSTICTAQDWKNWYYEKTDEPRTSRIGATMIFLAAEAITHILARTSVNTGVDRSNMWLTAMKNEFFFPVFSPTEAAKHYWALRGTQEGLIFTDPQMEIKGVHLKSSNVPKEIIAQGETMMRFICDEARAGRKISLGKLLQEVGKTERDILQRFKNADPHFTRLGSINTKDSYVKGDTQSNYIHHHFWVEVFAPKYGFHDEPPYQTIKLTGSHKTPRDTQEWLELMDVKHPDTAARVRAFMTKYNKEKLGSFMIPAQVALTVGIPDELLEAINVRKLTADITSIFYAILRNLGYYGMDKKLNMLISDRY